MTWKLAACSSSHTTCPSAMWLCCPFHWEMESLLLNLACPGTCLDQENVAKGKLCDFQVLAWVRKPSSFLFCLLRTQLMCKEAQVRLLNEKMERVTCPSFKHCGWGARHVSISDWNILVPVYHLPLCGHTNDKLRFHAADEPPCWA